MYSMESAYDKLKQNSWKCTLQLNNPTENIWIFQPLAFCNLPLELRVFRNRWQHVEHSKGIFSHFVQYG